jgi:arylsulfatase
MISHAYLIYGMQSIVALEIEDFKAFPPRQKAASFNLDVVLEQLNDAGGGAGH